MFSEEQDTLMNNEYIDADLNAIFRNAAIPKETNNINEHSVKSSNISKTKRNLMSLLKNTERAYAGIYPLIFSFLPIELNIL
jgi:hypothetical protein